MSDEPRAAQLADTPTFMVVELLAVVWAAKRLVIAGTLLCAFAAGLATLLMPKVYESTATLLLLPPPFKERVPETRIEKDTVGLFPKLLDPMDYADLLKDAALLLKVVDRLRAGGTCPEEELEKLAKPSVLAKRMTVETRVAEKTVYRTEYSPVIRLIAQGPSPEIARDIAQAWGEIAVEEAAKFYERQGGGLSAFFTDQYGKTRTDLEQVFAQEREVETAWDEPSARERLVEKAILLTRLEDDRAKTFANMEAARKEVEEMATRLAQEKATVTMWKSPPTTALFLGESLNPAGKPGETPAEDKKKGYYEETPNETYLYLQQELAHRQAALKGLEAREQSLRESIEMTKKEQEGLREEAARYNAEKKILLRQSEALTRGYDLLADKLRQAQIAESEQKNLVDLKLVANPVMPDRKVAPMRTPIVFTAALLGFILSSLAVVIRRRLQKGLRMKVEG